MTTQLVYGYMRLTRKENDQLVHMVEDNMKRYADRHGFAFGCLFKEVMTDALIAFDQMATQIQRVGAQYVVVPSLDHLSPNKHTRSELLEILEQDAKVQVIALDNL